MAIARLAAMLGVTAVVLGGGGGRGGAGWSRAAAAEAEPGPASVAVIRPPPGDPVLDEASARIQLEMAAVGHQSRLVDCPRPDANNCASLSSAVRIWLSREEGTVIIQVVATVPDGLELRRHVRVVPADGGEDPSVLAVRAVELLRDIYLDVPRVSAPSAAVSTPRAVPASNTPPSPSPISARISAGIGLLRGRGGLGPAAAPVFAMGESFPHHLVGTAMLGGPFSNTMSAGSVSSREWVVLFALRYELGAARLRPFVSVGTGLHYIRVSSAPSATAMVAGSSNSAVAPLLAGGVGVSFRIVSWLFAIAEGDAFFTQPSTDVTSGAVVLGRAGAPSVLLDVALSLSFP